MNGNTMTVEVVGYSANDRPLVGGQFPTKTTYGQLLGILKQCDPEVVYAKILIKTI